MYAPLSKRHFTLRKDSIFNFLPMTLEISMSYFIDPKFSSVNVVVKFTIYIYRVKFTIYIYIYIYTYHLGGKTKGRVLGVLGPEGI